MDKKYYEIAKRIQDLVHNDANYEPRLRSMVNTIVSYKKKPIMSWFLIYLKGICSILKMNDMDDYKPLEEVDGIKIHYAITVQEVIVMTNRAIGYPNHYNLNEESFIRAHLSKYTEWHNVNRIIAFHNCVWFVNKDNIPDNFKVVPLDEIEKTELPSEKIGTI